MGFMCEPESAFAFRSLEWQTYSLWYIHSLRSASSIFLGGQTCKNPECCQVECLAPLYPAYWLGLSGFYGWVIKRNYDML